MEVILLQDTEFGDKGTVVKVANGYARNFLLPRGIAVEKTASSLKHVEEISVQRKKKLEKEKAEVEQLAKKINSADAIVLKAKGGENGAMFGSITHEQIAEAIKSNIGVEVDRRRIMVKAIKDGGVTEIPIKLTFGIVAIAKINVELEIEKKKDESAAAKKKKLRKKEEIAAEIEAQEAAVAAPVAEAEAPAKEKKAKKATKKKEAAE